MKFFNISKKPILNSTEGDKKLDIDKAESEKKNAWNLPLIYVSKIILNFPSYKFTCSIITKNGFLYIYQIFSNL